MTSESGSITVTVGFDSFDEWWAPYTMGVGPAGSYVAGLDDRGRESLEARLPGASPPAAVRGRRDRLDGHGPG